MRTASRSGRSGGGRAPVANEILINAVAGETRVALLEQGVFTELYVERDTDRNVTGTVTFGRVTRVLPGMQAAFVDIGLEKAAFLYAGDYLDENGKLDADPDEDSPRPRRGRGREAPRPPRIETLLDEGQEIVVQVAKDPIGTKGARITSHLSIAGRHLVLTPWSKRVGVSRQIESDRERRRLREVVTRLRPPELGFIIRTAGEGAREADLEADVRYLSSVWDDIQRKKGELRPPSELFSELSLPLRVIRDFANARTRRIAVDDAAVHEEMKLFLERFVADPQPKLEHYTGREPIFDHFAIESRIDENLGKKVWLKSGGYLIVDQSEALTAIDVNTGRYVGKRDLEETVLKTNLEAVKEVVHQLRFRNIGGLIIIDLIDMESAENRDKVNRALQEAIRLDKSKTNILKISELGLVEMTRKRTRENLVQLLCEPCGYCEGRGYVLSPHSVAFKVMREIRKDLPRFCGRQLAVAVNPQVAETLLGPARRALAKLGKEIGCEIEVRARPTLHQEQFEVTTLDAGPPVSLSLPWLGRDEPEPAAAPAGATEPAAAQPAGDEPASGTGEDAPERSSEEAPDETPPQGRVEPLAAAPEDAAGDALPEPPGPPAEEVPELLPVAAAAPQTLDSPGEDPILPASEKREDS